MRNVVVSLVVMFCLLSCKTEQCDFQVTDTLDRSDLIQLPLNEQRSIFSSLSPEIKSKLYQYKFKQDLSEQNLSRQEKKVLKQLMDYAVPETYKNGPVSNEEEFKFLQTLDELGWDQDRIFKYTMVIMTVNEFDKKYPADN